MNIFKRITSAVLAAGLAFTAASAEISPDILSADAASVVSISPFNKYAINNGIFEGWGTSLCWWANRVGYSDSLAQQCADTFFGENGLRMNIARFNIGGGDDPSHKHITRTDSNMPGYTVYNNGSVSYDWNADHNQRNVLQRAVKAAGDDAIVEMFSNSPPYYMTKSGCSTGNTDAGKNNLKDDCYDDFAEYLAEVCYQYENYWGIKVQSVEAMNEPYTNFWGAFSNKQEGCHFDIGSSESNIILELQKSMNKRGMNDVILCGTDETSIDTQINAYNSLSWDAKAALGRIDTHTYSGSKRAELKDIALNAGKNLWMSEVDGNGTAGTNAGEMAAGLWLADRMQYDCNNLECSAWILWQVIDNHISSVGYNGNKDKGMVNVNGGFWGLAVADHDNDKIVLTKKYYSFGQYSRYIRPGMTMLRCSDGTMAAYDKENHQLVIVTLNKSGSAADYSYDLSGFDTVGKYAQAIRTSNSENWKDLGNTALSGDRLNVSLAPNSITTFIISDVTGDGSLGNEISSASFAVSGSEPWKNDSANNAAKAFDGNTSTFFDGVSNGWIQADLGGMYDISAIGFCPRQGYEYRMADSYFQFSQDGTNWSTAYTVEEKPSFGMHYTNKFGCDSKARYIRYAVPNGAPQNQYNKDSSYCCNIAEIKLYGVPAEVAELNEIVPVALSGSNAYKSSQNTYEKAFDGDGSSFFDGVGNGWIQADLGGLYDVSAISFSPRNGYEYRMADGMFMLSQDGVNWTTAYTVKGTPKKGTTFVTDLGSNTSARYVRYQVPEGKPDNGVNMDDVYCCNIAEMKIYGEKSDAVICDLNADGKFSTADAVLLQEFILCKASLSDKQLLIADLNGDGTADVFDMILCRRMLIGG